MGTYRLPADVSQLPWLLRLMHLAVSARTTLREQQYGMPSAPAQELHTVSILHRRSTSRRLSC